MSGITRDSKHQYYLEGKGPYPGVTSITRLFDKSGPLIGWAQRETAAAAIRELARVFEHVSRHERPDTYCGICMSASAPWLGPENAAVAWLKRMPGYQRDAAADLGTKVHVLAEQIARGKQPEITEEQRPYVEAYQRFLAEKKPVFKGTEYYVFSPRYLYGGTVDAACLIDGQLWAPLDYKTGKDVYEEVELQLAGYRGATLAGNSGDGKVYRPPKGSKAGVLHIRPDKYETGYRLIEYQLDGAWPVFLHLRGVYPWAEAHKNGRAK